MPARLFEQAVQQVEALQIRLHTHSLEGYKVIKLILNEAIRIYQGHRERIINMTHITRKEQVFRPLTPWDYITISLHNGMESLPPDFSIVHCQTVIMAHVSNQKTDELSNKSLIIYFQY